MSAILRFSTLLQEGWSSQLVRLLLLKHHHQDHARLQGRALCDSSSGLFVPLHPTYRTCQLVLLLIHQRLLRCDRRRRLLSVSLLRRWHPQSKRRVIFIALLVGERHPRQNVLEA